MVAHTAAHDHALIGAILISAGDMGLLGEEPDKSLVADMADNMEGLSGVTAQSMADEDRANAKAFRLENTVVGLTQVPLLVVTADGGLAPQSDALVHAIEAKGGHADIRSLPSMSPPITAGRTIASLWRARS